MLVALPTKRASRADQGVLSAASFFHVLGLVVVSEFSSLFLFNKSPGYIWHP